MKHTLSAIAIALLLAGCGGGDGAQQNSDQPWVGGNGDDSGEGENTNQPPVINGEPSGTLEIVFSGEKKYQITTSDTDGDEVELSLVNAPSWVSLTEEDELIVHPTRLKNASGIVLMASDGTTSVETEPFDVVVLEPDQIAYQIAVPPRTSLGDQFTLRFKTPDGEVIAYGMEVSEQSLKEGASIALPYPYKGSLIEGSDVSLVWTHSGYAEYSRWIGSSIHLYNELGDDLELPIDTRRSHTPSAISTAYNHLLISRQGDNSDEYVFSNEYAHQLNPSIRAEDVLELAAYYDLAHSNGLLIGLNSALENDLNKRRSKPGLNDSLISTVDEIRRSESTLVNNAYWQDLLRETKSQLEAPKDTLWSNSRWQLLSPVDARFGAAFGVTLKLAENQRYAIKDPEGNLPWVSESGSWSVEGNSLTLTHDQQSSQETTKQINVDDDVVRLREALIEQLSIDHETAKKWSQWIFSEGLRTTDFTLSPANQTRLTTVFESVNGDRSVRIEQVGKIYFEQKEEAAFFIQESTDRLARSLPVDQTSYFEFREPIFEVVLPWPNTEGELRSDGQFAWIDLNESPLVRKRTVTEEGMSFETTSWSVEYQPESRKFIFGNPQHPSGALRYTLAVSDTPSLDSRSSGETNSRRYAAHAKLEKDGLVLYEGPVNLTLHPKSRCEVAERCSPEAVAQSNLLWADNNRGIYPEPDLNGFVRVDILEQVGEQDVVDFHYVHVVEGSDCLGSSEQCLVAAPNTSPFTIEGVESEGNTTWKISNPGQLWAPVKVDNQGFSVWESGADWRYYAATRFESDDKLWRCSKVNPEVQSFLSGSDEEQASLRSNFEICFD